MTTKSKQFETPMGVVTATAEYLRHFVLTIPGADGQPVKIGRIMRGAETWAAGYADDKRSYFDDKFAKRRDAAAYLIERAVHFKLAPKPAAKIEKPAKAKKAKATSEGGEKAPAKAKAAPKAKAPAKPKAAPKAKAPDAQIEAELMQLLGQKASSAPAQVQA